MSHTPGPWGFEWSEANKSFEIAPLDKDSECDWAHEVCITADDSEANARLIAAAPELLEALKTAEIALVNCVPITPYHGDGPLVSIRAAIAKATGGAQ